MYCLGGVRHRDGMTLIQAFVRNVGIIELSPYFNAGSGRPAKDLYTVMGVLFLQQTHDLTHEEAVDQLCFNIQWHYAFNITEESESAKYMCPKTLWNMRTIVAENGLEKVLSNAGTHKLAEVFNVYTDKQRIDSVHIGVATKNPHH